ncbi:23S rRNA (adenine2030-N6)-methyltransferase [Colwellia chukchiensis]|uniref:Ribosomal RNA large subunit methyltransferase J n=1 Tax=Colwellia chukchiensis TaxID=641665 RepID=A0A1H7LV51_9GAMM|nr:23S rRNA (adenine(2030)-N(6))-methyltransferase RlmJ [Colwellia chukchiensis]SEL02820.1 23S rRNA (adenine2030-N6)-methyltransferase [Colwellia chukchiensis]
MLSYRHAFHAGNFADVLKHSVLTLVLEYMTRKDKGFYYIDSHAGAGMYQLTDPYAQKTGEYKAGIAKLIAKQDAPAALQTYIKLVAQLNQQALADKADITVYPGSPGIARHFTRRQDSAHMFELHPSDIGYLTEFCQRWNKAHVKQADGYQGVLSLLPPPSRRGVVLIDPPYELKEDYLKAVRTIVSGYKKFATGTYILWYPVVKRELVEQMQAAFMASELRNVLQVEYCQQADTLTYGMTGTGLFIVNPPWQLKAQLTEILPYLTTTLGSTASQHTLTQLIEE